MSTKPEQYDVIIIGSGPAGQKAAVQLAKAGQRVIVCERLRQVGGACVHQGTIPSKALRERAWEFSRLQNRMAGRERLQVPGGSVVELIGEMSDIVQAHDQYIAAQLERNQIEVLHGRAAFVDPHTVEVLTSTGHTVQLTAAHILIATGSKPRHPDHVGIDHENIYDSDSVLTLGYLPQSMVVLGGGVIACEYASIFASLGTRVTIIDSYPTPLGFLDTDLTARFMRAFERKGGVLVGNAEVVDCRFDGVSQVNTTLADGTVIKSDKVLCALGRIADLDSLHIERAGLTLNPRSLLSVDQAGRTEVAHIYAAGDVIGPPSLASASMEQGRRAACHILGLPAGHLGDALPSGIYAIPELASVGLTEAQARERFDQVVVGCSDFREIARGHIADAKDGMLKLVVSGDAIVRGVHVCGTNATDLVHIGQMGMLMSAHVQVYIETVFNFPTYAESYRVAALSAAQALAELPAAGQTDAASGSDAA